MSTIMPKGENLRQAVKWISENLKEDENAKIPLLIEKAGIRFKSRVPGIGVRVSG